MFDAKLYLIIPVGSYRYIVDWMCYNGSLDLQQKNTGLLKDTYEMNSHTERMAIAIHNTCPAVVAISKG